jgi:hypothetical protein
MNEFAWPNKNVLNTGLSIPIKIFYSIAINRIFNSSLIVEIVFSRYPLFQKLNFITDINAA